MSQPEATGNDPSYREREYNLGRVNRLLPGVVNPGGSYWFRRKLIGTDFFEFEEDCVQILARVEGKKYFFITWITTHFDPEVKPESQGKTLTKSGLAVQVQRDSSPEGTGQLIEIELGYFLSEVVPGITPDLELERIEELPLSTGS